MTENKRFECTPTNDNGWVVLDRGNILWRKEIIHLLNELHEENEKLKNFLKELEEFDGKIYTRNGLAYKKNAWQKM